MRRREARLERRTTLSEYERDFDNCRMLNSMIVSTLKDAQAGLTSEHKALSDIRMGVNSMELLDCDRFSSTIAPRDGQHRLGVAAYRVIGVVLLVGYRGQEGTSGILPRLPVD